MAGCLTRPGPCSSDAARKLLADDVDPSRKKKQYKIARADAATNNFEALAEDFLQKNSREGKSEATLNKKRWLIGLAIKDLQSKPIGEINAADILVPLRRIEAELAHVSGNGVRRAYHRAPYWEERVRMAEWWAERIGEVLDDRK